MARAAAADFPHYRRKTPLSEIGRVVEVFWQACSIDPLLFAQVTTTAALQLFDTIIEPDFKEFVHKATGRSVVKHIKQAVLDTSEGKPALGAGGRRFVFNMAEKVDLAVWYYFLASVAYEGGQNWGSMVYQASSCASHRPGFVTFGHRPFGGVSSGAPWFPAFAWVESAPTPGRTLAPLAFIPPGSTGNVSVVFHPFPLIGPLTPYDIRLRDMATGNILAFFDTPFNDVAAAMGGVAWKANIPPQPWTQALLWEVSVAQVGVHEMGALTGTVYIDISAAAHPNVVTASHDALTKLARVKDEPLRGFAPLTPAIAEQIGWRGSLTPQPQPT